LLLHPRLRYAEVKGFFRQVWTLSLATRLEAEPADKVGARQDRLLRPIVRYAYRNVPYYRKVFDSSGIHPSSIEGLSDLPRLPFLTKSQVLENYPQAIVSREHTPKSSFVSSSSGTTGIRASFLIDWPTRHTNFALLYRARSLFGYRPKHLECRFSWRPDIKEKWFHRLGFMRLVRISHLSPAEEVLGQMVRIRPDVVYGYPSFLYTLAERCEKASLRGLKLLFILTSGELLDDRMRSTIEDFFGTRVVDLYGSAEHNFISSECPVEGTHHVNMLNLAVEIVRDGEPVSPGEDGEIVITQLTNRAMPLIRYRTGDTGRIAEDGCRCGRTGTVLEVLHGRKDDFIANTRGELFSPIIVRNAVTRQPIGAYRIVQDRVGRIVVEHTGPLDGEFKASVGETMRAVLADEDFEVYFRRVDRIEPDKSGKRRVVISKVRAATRE